MQDQKVDRKIINIAITTPGWPRSSYPNGIVTYVHNILHGFDDKTNAIVFAAPLVGTETKDKIINLSKLLTTKNLLQKIVDKILSRFSFSYVRDIQYRRAAAINAQRINLAIQNLSQPLDVIEIEESFGTANFLLKMTNTPIVTRIHGPWFTMGDIMHANKNWDFKLRVFYEGEAIKNSQGVTAPSLDVLEQVRAYYGFALPHAQVIPNPVPEVDVSNQWQLDKDKRQYILFVGRFDLHKGGDLMLNAFRFIALKNNTIELLFVGPDRKVIVDGEDVNFNEYLERFLPESAIKDRIQYLGHCDQDRISDLRKNALVTVVCSRYENFPLSLLESLAVGCPTVATAVGGMKEIIIDDFNGLLAEPESPESIAEKVLMLISDPEKMQRLSKNAIEDCKKRFSPEVVAAQTVEYYQSVLARVSDLTAKN